MPNLRVALVGSGGITAHYLDVYRALDWVRVVVCMDAQKTVADSAADFLSQDEKTKPLATTDFASALADDVDVVVINTPNHLHHAQAIPALEAGKHVLLQKPIAPTVKEAEEIAAAARNARGLAGLYMSYFDQPLLHDLKAMKAAGFFGDVNHYYAKLMHRWGMLWSTRSLEGQGTWRESTSQTGGGCFVQLAVHFTHILEWISDERIVRATAVTRNLRCPGTEGEDIASAILEFESGALATLDMAWNSYGEQLSIHGTGGSAEYINNRLLVLESRDTPFKGRVVDYTPSTAARFPEIQGTEQTTELSPPAMSDYNNPLNQHRIFLEAVRDGKQPFVPMHTGLDDLRIVAAVYESARRGCTVPVQHATTAVVTKSSN
jgi:predicted dehydrogenase